MNWAAEIRRAKRQFKRSKWNIALDNVSSFPLNRLITTDRQKGNAKSLAELDKLRQQRLSVLGYKQPTIQRDDTSTRSAEQPKQGTTIAGKRYGAGGSNRNALIAGSRNKSH